jgi:hypothetical protein
VVCVAMDADMDSLHVMLYLQGHAHKFGFGGAHGINSSGASTYFLEQVCMKESDASSILFPGAAGPSWT